MMLDWQSWLRRGVALVGLPMCACYSTCGDGTPPAASITGELGNGTFEYRCIGSGDPVCEEFNLAGGDFPDCIAVGGRFRLDYTLRDISERDEDEIEPFLHIESASESYLSESESVFMGQHEGRTALIAYDHDVVVDLIHLDVIQPDSIEVIDALDPQGPVTELHMHPDDAQVFRVFPRSTRCPQLGGAIDFHAQSNAQHIASVRELDVLEIEANADGHATISVGLGDLGTKIEVFVAALRRTHPTPVTAGDESSSDGGASSDSGSGDTSSDSSASSDSSGSTGG